MNSEIKPFDGKAKTIMALADAYYKSYCELSKNYKSEAEMALYKKGTFIKKLKKFSKDSESSVFVYFENEQPLGFIRYSPVPEYYKAAGTETRDLEKGIMNGYDFAWYRKVKFDETNKIDDKTVIVNQIYLDPQIQNKGVGTQMFKSTLPLIKNLGYESMIIEYNAHNNNAKRFYHNVLGLERIAQTQDFDNIITPEKRAEFCISPVEIGHAMIDSSIKNINMLEQKYFERKAYDKTNSGR